MFSVGPSNSYLALALHNFLTQTYESLPILWFFFNISVHGEGKAPYHDISSIFSIINRQRHTRTSAHNEKWFMVEDREVFNEKGL